MTADGSDLAILIPLWQRTKHIERVYASARAATPKALIVVIASAEDHAVTDVVRYVTGDRVRALIIDGAGGTRGDYAAKINAGYRATDEPFLFTGADDLDFHPDWYAPAVDLMGTVLNDDEYESNPMGVAVVGTVDLCNDRTKTGEHSTHSLVARWYADCCAVIDQPGAIYSEAYYHEWCDDELVGHAQATGAYAHSFESVVEHLHPNVGKSPDDVTYRRGRAMSRASRRVWTARRKLWEAR